MDHTTIALYNRIFLAVFFVFVAVFYIALIRIKQYKSPQRLVNKGKKFSLHWYNHLTFGLFRATILIVCVVRVFAPSLDNWLLTFDSHTAFVLIGQLLMILGFGFAMGASLTMRHAWRSGIDTTKTTPLITHGLYKFSRNPNYLGVQVAQLGFFLALPSMFTLICLFFGWACIRIQVRLEESQLTKQFTKEYQHYTRRTPRWLALKNTFTFAALH